MTQKVLICHKTKPTNFHNNDNNDWFFCLFAGIWASFAGHQEADSNVEPLPGVYGAGTKQVNLEILCTHTHIYTYIYIYIFGCVPAVQYL